VWLGKSFRWRYLLEDNRLVEDVQLRKTNLPVEDVQLRKTNLSVEVVEVGHPVETARVVGGHPVETARVVGGKSACWGCRSWSSC